jgi:hypothetical protein
MLSGGVFKFGTGWVRIKDADGYCPATAERCQAPGRQAPRDAKRRAAKRWADSFCFSSRGHTIDVAEELPMRRREHLLLNINYEALGPRLVRTPFLCEALLYWGVRA